MFYEEAYPDLSKAMTYFKQSKEGQDRVCKAVEDIAKEREEIAKKEGEKIGCINTLVSLVKDGLLTPEVAARRLSMSLNEFADLIEGTAE